MINFLISYIWKRLVVKSAPSFRIHSILIVRGSRVPVSRNHLILRKALVKKPRSPIHPIPFRARSSSGAESLAATGSRDGLDRWERGFFFRMRIMTRITVIFCATAQVSDCARDGNRPDADTHIHRCRIAVASHHRRRHHYHRHHRRRTRVTCTSTACQ